MDCRAARNGRGSGDCGSGLLVDRDTGCSSHGGKGGIGGQGQHVSVTDFPSILVRRAVPEQEVGPTRWRVGGPFVRPFTNEPGQSFGLLLM